MNNAEIGPASPARLGEQACREFVGVLELPEASAPAPIGLSGDRQAYQLERGRGLTEVLADLDAARRTTPMLRMGDEGAGHKRLADRPSER